MPRTHGRLDGGTSSLLPEQVIKGHLPSRPGETALPEELRTGPAARRSNQSIITHFAKIHLCLSLSSLCPKHYFIY